LHVCPANSRRVPHSEPLPPGFRTRTIWRVLLLKIVLPSPEV